MNGIVHPCSHPEDKAPPETEEEMMLEVFIYTERVVNMVRPRKLLMIAVGMFNIRVRQQGIIQLRWAGGWSGDGRMEILENFHLFRTSTFFFFLANPFHRWSRPPRQNEPATLASVQVRSGSKGEGG